MCMGGGSRRWAWRKRSGVPPQSFFNPETWIPFELSQDDVQGKRIRQLQLGLVTAGRHVTADRRPIGMGRVKRVRL